MADPIDFRTWRRNFERSLRGMAALRDLEKYFPRNAETNQPPLANHLRDEVLASCYAANRFRRDRDPAKSKRDANRDALNALPVLSRAVRKVQALVRQHHHAYGMAFAHASVDLKYLGITITGVDMPNDARLLERILEVFLARLVRTIPLVTAGDLVSRFPYGCLHFETPLDDGTRNRLPDVETMLLFDLVQTFRLYSQKTYRRQQGEIMPKDGRPHYSLAVAFVNATFSNRLRKNSGWASSRLKAFITKNPNVGYCPWPDLPQWTTTPSTPLVYRPAETILRAEAEEVARAKAEKKKRGEW